MERLVSPPRRAFGQGVDADPARRPGVPREAAPAPAEGARPEPPPIQGGGRAALARTGSPRATPVFGTAAPAHGVSGAIRRVAYRVPEHRASRWMLLVLADRVDVLEHRAAQAWLVAPAAAAVAIGYAAVARALRRGA